MNYQLVTRDCTVVATGRDMSMNGRMKARTGDDGDDHSPPRVRVKRVTPDSLKYMDLFRYSMN
jgi:hypothetical protein